MNRSAAMNEPMGLLTVPEVAALLRIGRNTAYGLIATKQLPHVRIGRTLRVPRSALERWLAETTQMPAIDTDDGHSLYSPHRHPSAR
jgi:excisionase family DNA binding protein